MLYQLLYTSVSVDDVDEHALLDLQIEACDKNKRLGITGLWVYRHKSFVRLLEGEKEQVLDVYQSVCEDSRHASITTGWQGEIEERGFVGWAMAYQARL